MQKSNYFVNHYEVPDNAFDGYYDYFYDRELPPLDDYALDDHDDDYYVPEVDDEEF